MKNSIGISVCVLILAMSGCLYENDGREDAQTQVSLIWALTKPGVAEQIYNVLIQIEADDLRTIHENFLLGADETQSPKEVRMSVPSGRDREFSIIVTDNLGERAYDGRTKTDLSPGSQSVSISLKGWSQVRGILREYEPATDGPGDPIGNVEGAVVGEDQIGVTTDNAGEFFYEVANGVDVEIEGGVDENTLGMASLIGSIGGEDFAVELIAVDPDTRPHQHTVQGIVSSSADPDQLHIYGQYALRAADPIVAIIEDPDGGGFRVETIADADDETHVVVPLPQLETSFRPYRVLLRNEYGGDSNWFELTVS